MEHAIGTKITLEVVENNESCEECIFSEFKVCYKPERLGNRHDCFEEYRTDHKNIIYKEIKEK